MKLTWRICLCLTLIALTSPIVSGAGTSDVFSVQTTLHGVIQRGANRASVINKVMISTDDLINLAQSRELGTTVPNNEILALINDCSTNDPSPTRLTVFDKASTNIITTLGTLTNFTVAVASRKHMEETISQITINNISTTDTNGVLHGITGGNFFYHQVNRIDTNDCPGRFGGQLTGFLGTAFPKICTTNVLTFRLTNCTDCVTNCMPECVITCDSNSCKIVTNRTPVSFPCTDAIDVIISRSPIQTGKPIGAFAPGDTR